MHNAVVANTTDGHRTQEGDDKIKMHTHSYCCLDYAQVLSLSLSVRACTLNIETFI
jgi:hypothetical protein